MSRTTKTARNSAVGLFCTILSSLLSFVLRALFIRLLGLEYAGVNTLFTDILNILNLADLGFNNAILFRLYKSIADGDDEKTEILLSTYRKICYVVSAIIAVAGLALIPFLSHFVKEAPTFSEPLWSLYIIVLATSVANHLLGYKNTLLIAKQDRYISTVIQYISIFLRNGLQILVLAVFKNIYLYLLVSLFTAVLQGLVSGIVSVKRYKLSWFTKKKLPKSEVKELTKDVGALSVYKVCRTLDATVDTFLISKFISVATTAIYGSINMLLSAMNELLGTFNDGMIASVGDLNASEDKSHVSSVFYQSFHFTYLIYGIITATFVPFISPFSQWWIGNTLDEKCIYIMLINFMMYGFGLNVATFRNSMGIFTKGWIRPAVTAVLNLLFSLLLVNYVGLIGTLLGTLIARTLTLVWYDPWLVIHHGMKKSPVKYYLRYILYMCFTALISVVLLLVRSVLPSINGILSLIWQGALYFIISAVLTLLLGAFIPEQKSIFNRVLVLLQELTSKFRKAK
ncbi:MAG: oligosaccharide flippase family protein [Clostridia bacterium]|nr:oligosaccharide flippase family protein [Clostridia bacterium]